jgi:hypothetical protein
MSEAPREIARTVERGRRVTPHAFWPGPDTELLLRAALEDGATARRAFDEWIARGCARDPSRLPAPDRRLLPLVAASLRAAGGSHPYLAECEEWARGAGARVRRLLGVAAGAIAELAGAGLPALALKGVPLVLGYYASPGLRLMTDVDLMVRPADLPRALEALRGAGWRERPIPPPFLPWLCALELEREGAKLDLHQYLSEHGSTPAAERGLWARARPLRVLGADCLAPSPADLLAQVCLGALKFGHDRNSRWVIDAARIVRRGDVDWEVLVEDARLRRAALPLREALSYLAERFAVAVPPRALDALWALPAGDADRRRYRALTRDAGGRRELLDEYRARYASAAQARGERESVAGFARFAALLVGYRWSVARPRDLPGAVLARVRRRLRIARRDR